jgi:hypothetical protein
MCDRSLMPCLALIAICGLAFLSCVQEHAARAEGVSLSQTRSTDKGRLVGVVTLTCPQNAVGCSERPYQVPLTVWRRGRPQLPHAVPVTAAGKFSIALAPGTYKIASGDVRGACCLPILDPVTVSVAPRQTSEVHVRFRPGFKLPTR